MTPFQTAPTLDDVAKAAGVSTATVSRCLNMPKVVSEDTRTKVLHAVEQLGYTPNFGAQVMASKRSRTIGAIIPTMENAIFARGLQAFQETLHELDYTLLVSSTAYRPEVEAKHIKSLVARGADGLLLIGYERDAALYDYLARKSVPTLLSWAHSAGNPHPATGFDNRAAMRLLADEVVKLGHRNIAVISARLQGNDRASERLAGIKESLEAAGINSGKVQVVETSYEIENGAKAFAQLMQSEPRPTAIMCGNDVLAVGAIQHAQATGLRVPEDISITGFDDIELARIVTPNLTTVHVPHRQMGRQAALELIAMVEGRSTGKSSQLDVSLAMRASLAVPAGNA